MAWGLSQGNRIYYDSAGGYPIPRFAYYQSSVWIEILENCLIYTNPLTAHVYLFILWTVKYVVIRLTQHPLFICGSKFDHIPLRPLHWFDTISPIWCKHYENGTQSVNRAACSHKAPLSLHIVLPPRRCLGYVGTIWNLQSQYLYRHLSSDQRAFESTAPLSIHIHQVTDERSNLSSTRSIILGTYHFHNP